MDGVLWRLGFKSVHVDCLLASDWTLGLDSTSTWISLLFGWCRDTFLLHQYLVSGSSQQTIKLCTICKDHAMGW